MYIWRTTPIDSTELMNIEPFEVVRMALDVAEDMADRDPNSRIRYQIRDWYGNLMYTVTKKEVA